MLVRLVPFKLRNDALWRLRSGRPAPSKKSGEDPMLFRDWRLLADQLLVLQLAQKIGNIREKLCPRQGKFFSEFVRNFIHGAASFDHLPDPGPHRIQAETKTLVDVEQHGTVLIDSLSYTLCYFHQGMVHRLGHLHLLWRSRGRLPICSQFEPLAAGDFRLVTRPLTRTFICFCWPE